jgi:short-subunit dehydrogenase
MPGVVKTEMIAGYARTPLVRWVEPEDVAEAIVDALRRPRVDVFVPRSLGRIYKVMQLLPRRAREGLTRLLGVDRVTWEADRSARGDYEARARRAASPR